ncbi:uncharacterized protein ColSpa_07480 [Colletotrichum spaethianum]|uniref:Uncharacterized protein n=1 Tax=Colletotrichum spaethianum TaxID=700344 RepID=A0AA37P849_9PEZI|nr:uncharacterized protein ColSpa_07480 [Colletotrichum spaethianum]GKT47299.1 hypothetical protein ColSpa_07480 [Colletotrichum spaethianum]
MSARYKEGKDEQRMAQAQLMPAFGSCDDSAMIVFAYVVTRSLETSTKQNKASSEVGIRNCLLVEPEPEYRMSQRPDRDSPESQ